jgi:hypothetical protein
MAAISEARIQYQIPRGSGGSRASERKIADSPCHLAAHRTPVRRLQGQASDGSRRWLKQGSRLRGQRLQAFGGCPLARPNLLKIDDVLLRASALTGLAWSVGSLALLAIAAGAGSGLGGPIALILASSSAPLGLLIAGNRLRGREKRAWALHRLVDDHVEIPAGDLLRDSDFTAATLARAIKDLNNAGAAFLVWDRAAGMVQDGRLRSARLHVEDCLSCGAKVSLNVPIGQAALTRCPYCQAALDAAWLRQEKARLIDELDRDPEPAGARDRKESGFSLAIFVVLLVAFWPLGVGYALWHWQAIRADD